MPLTNYGVLKGKVVASRREEGESSPHYQVHVIAGETSFRVPVNVKSQVSPSELLYLVNDHYQHPVLARLFDLPNTFTALPSTPGGTALDFIRGNLFDRQDMQPLPHDLPGQDNDLNDLLEHYMLRAHQDPNASIYAFGQRWGPEPNTPDKIFGFKPGNGVHDIHMNQGNVNPFTGDDGVWQDGALVFHFPALDQWVGIFLAFQSQSWHTDDQTGHTIPEIVEKDGVIRIVGALANPIGPAPEQEKVILLNTSPDDIDLNGWMIADKMKHKQNLSGRITAGDVAVVILSPQVQLGNKGGIISLLDNQGLKVDGVSYTAEQASQEGWTIVF
jgi:uncharacterized protein YukJ